VSGYDLTRCRWDTSEHARGDTRRVDHRGERYGPFHDVGAVVTGDCARALGDLVGERWRRATGALPRRGPAGDADRLWPANLAPDACDLDVAIARTEPSFGGRDAVTEIRALHEDAIASARRHVFAENQYFTSRTITDAFTARLRDAGPEIAVVSPYAQSGWLEISTMGALRARIHRALRSADPDGRYRLYCPTLEWLPAEEGCLNVHSKVLVVDDDLLTLGSANLSERSLGVDTECNLVIEAGGDPRIADVIARFRNRLLAEHLATTPERVAEALAREGSLHRAIEALGANGRRSLAAVEPKFDAALDAVVPDPHVFDPEQPLDPDCIAADLAPHEALRSSTRGRLIGTLAGVAALAAMALAWRFTPLHEWLALERLVALGEGVRDEAWAPLAVLLAYVGAGLFAFPLIVLVAVTALVFGPWLGPVYTVAGATLSAALTFAIGRHLGRETIRRIAGHRVNELSRRLARRGLLAIVFVRMLPIAPFSIVNVVAGASHIRWFDFLLGTVVGLLPGILSMTFFVDRAIAAIRDPRPQTFALLGVALAIVVALVLLLRRTLRRRRDREAGPIAHAG
jgi:uncharacterized membrane protein YdjX (TVP38/TMEM64 family)